MSAAIWDDAKPDEMINGREGGTSRPTRSGSLDRPRHRFPGMQRGRSVDPRCTRASRRTRLTAVAHLHTYAAASNPWSANAVSGHSHANNLTVFDSRELAAGQRSNSSIAVREMKSRP